MGNLMLAKENNRSALARLYEAIEDVKNIDLIPVDAFPAILDKERLERSLRDSLIQRFEFCVELFWKYIKRYEEEVLELALDVNTPRFVITAACNAKIISEVDAEMLLEMLRGRNVTSHLYKEEVAEQLSAKIPYYYVIMKKYIEAL